MTENKNRVCCLYRVSTDKQVDFNSNHEADLPMQMCIRDRRGISSRTMRTAKSRIGDKLVTEKDGTAWVCYLRD